MTLAQLLLPTSVWIEIKDGDDHARSVFDRHYSRNPAMIRQPAVGAAKLMMGPGEKLMLTTPCRRAIFAWRNFKDDSGQEGVNCAIFRNEGAGLSSWLILEAERLAIARWGKVRFYTYVDPRKVASPNPGYCFKCAGWRLVGITKKRKFLIFAKEPEWF